jgi:hypothetical protein
MSEGGLYRARLVRGKMRVITLLACAALALAGCGGDDDENGDGGTGLGKEDPAQVAPRAKPSLDETAAEFKAAIESGECRDLFEVGVHSTKRPPGKEQSKAAPTREECSTLETFAESFDGYEPGKSATFHTAGVVDARLKDGPPLSSVFVLDVDGSWKHVLTTTPGSDPQVGSKPTADNEYDENVSAFVEAAGEKDCDEVFRLMASDSDVLQGPRSTKDAFCKDIGDAYRDPRAFFRRVADDKGAKPFLLGRTLDFAFYGLQLQNRRYYYTLLMARASDAAPTTDAHERDGLFNWFLAKE